MHETDNESEKHDSDDSITKVATSCLEKKINKCLLTITSPPSQTNLVHMMKKPCNIGSSNIIDVMLQTQLTISKISERNNLNVELKATEIDVMKLHNELEKDSKA